MKSWFHIMIVPDEGDPYTPTMIRDLLKQAEAQGHPLGMGSYLESLTIRQVDDLVHGRTDA